MMSITQKFRTTCWAMIDRLNTGSDSESAMALSEFCKSYHAPLRAYVASSYPNDADDLIQSFFEQMIERQLLTTADPAKGNLRSFLLTCLKRHIANHFRGLSAEKRGGKQAHLSIDAASGVVDPGLPPEALYHRLWAKEVLEHAILRLRGDWIASGRSDLFEELLPFLGYQRHEDEQQKSVALRLQMTTGALKTAIYRIRREYREVLLDEIGKTLNVKTEAEVLDELKNLMAWV